MILESWYWAQTVINAALVSSFYCLFAVAYVLVLGITNRINLAFGAIATWAGYSVVALADDLLTTTFWSPWLILGCALAAALANGAGFGVVFGRAILARLIGQPLMSTFVATFGLAIALEETIRLITGSRDAWLEPMLAEPLVSLRFESHDVHLSQIQAGVIVTAAVSCAAVGWIVAHTRFGRNWRAISQDPGMARLLGVDVIAVVSLAGVLSCLLVAEAGASFAAYYGNIAPYNGFTMGLKALFISIVGGARTIRGAVAGGIGIGLFETLWSALMPIELRDAASFTVLIAALIVFAPGKPDINTREVSAGMSER